MEKTLKRKRGDVERSQKARIAKKKRQEVAIEKTLAFEMNCELEGGPGVEENQPLLLKTIIALAMHGSASHEKRQSDVYQTIKTLDELTEQLNKDGFKISRSSVADIQRSIKTLDDLTQQLKNDGFNISRSGLYPTTSKVEYLNRR